MITENKLDVRTITMGISLRDCAHPNIDKFCQNVYDKITKSAEFLVKTGEDIETEYGIPIIHKRVSVTPIAIAADACKTDSYVPVAEAMDRAAKEIGINFIGGFSALVEKGFTHGDRVLINSIPQALATTDLVCSSVNLGSTKTGINMDCVREMGEVVKRTAELTRDQQALGCAKLVIFCNAPGDNPFMAGAFHGVSEADKVVSVGVSGPGVVKHALEDLKGADFTEIAETIKRTAFKITRVGQLVAREASKRLGVPFGIIDLSLAPTPAVGDSVARIIEEMGIESCGAPGTTAALALLNDAVKKGGLMASSHVGGLSGAFIPVSEDEGMIHAVSEGSLSIEKLEAMTCVCSVGLDMIAIEGDIGHHRRRGGYRHDQQQDDGCPRHPCAGQEGRRHGRVRRTARLLPDRAGAQSVQLRGLHRARRSHPRTDPQPDELMPAAGRLSLARRLESAIIE